MNEILKTENNIERDYYCDVCGKLNTTLIITLRYMQILPIYYRSKNLIYFVCEKDTCFEYFKLLIC